MKSISNFLQFIKFANLLITNKITIPADLEDTSRSSCGRKLLPVWTVNNTVELHLSPTTLKGKTSWEIQSHKP